MNTFLLDKLKICVKSKALSENHTIIIRLITPTLDFQNQMVGDYDNSKRFR